MGSDEFSLDDSSPRIMRLDDLNVGMITLNFLLEVLAGAETSYKEYSLRGVVSKPYNRGPR